MRQANESVAGPMALPVFSKIGGGILRHLRHGNAVQNVGQGRLRTLPHRMNAAAPGFSITRKTSNQTLIEGGWPFDRLDHLEQRGLLAVEKRRSRG